MLTTNEAARIWNSLDDRQRAQVRAGKLRLEDAADLNIPLGDIELNIAKRNTASRSLDSNIGAPEEAQGEYEGAPARAFDLAQATASLATRQAGGALDMLTPDATAPGLLRRQDEVATGGVYGVSKVAEALLPDVSALTPMGLLNRAARIQEQAASARLATQAADRAAEDARRKIAGKPSLAEETADQFGSIARQQAEEYALSVDRRLSRGHQEAVQRGGKLIDLDNPLGTAGNLINPLNWSDAATAFGPQVAAFMAPTAFAGIALRTARLSEAAQVAGGVTAEILSSAEANARGAADEVRKNGGSDEDARKAYDIVFGSSTAFNAATIGGASAAGLNPVAKLAATLKAGQRAPGTGAVISTATKSAVAEAVGEGPQGYMDQVASNVASGKPLTEGALSSGIAEAFMGAPAGGLSGLVSSSSVVQEQLKKNKELQDEFDRRQAELRAQRESDAANLRAAEEAKAAATAKDKKDLETINQPGAQMEMPFGSDLAGDPTQNDRVPTSVDLFSGETISATKVEQRRAANQAEIDKDPTFYTAEEALEENRRRVEAAKSVLPKTQRKTELSEEVAASIPFVKEGDIKTLPGDRKLTDEQMYAREVDTKAAEKQIDNKQQDTFEQRKQAELDHRKALEDAKTTVSNKRNLLSTASITREADAKLQQEIATLSARPFNQTPQGQRALPTTIANYVASRKDLVVEEVRNARIAAVNSAEDLLIAEKDRKLDAEIESKLKAEDDAKAKQQEAIDKKKEEDRKAAEEAARPAGEQGELALGAPAAPKGGLFEDVSQPANPKYTGSLTDEEAESEVEAIRAANAKSRTASGKPAQKGAPKEKTAEETALEKEFAGAAAEEDTKRAVAAKAKWDKRNKAARKAVVSEALKALPEGTSEQRGALAAQLYTGWLRDNPEPKAPKVPEVTSETVEKQQKAIEAKEKAKATRATNKKVEKLLKEGKTKEEILADHLANSPDEELPPELEDTVRGQLTSQISVQNSVQTTRQLDTTPIVKRGDTLEQVMDAMVDNAPNDAARYLSLRIRKRLQELQKAGAAITVEISDDGMYWPRVNGRLISNRRPLGEASTLDVQLNGPHMGKQAGTSWEIVTHELAHAATFFQLYYQPEGTAAREMQELYSKLREHVLSKPVNQRTAFEKEFFANNNNALRDAHELLAWGLTNSDMQVYLSGIPSTKAGSFLHWLFDVVAKALGLGKTPSMLNDFLTIADELLIEKLDSYVSEANSQGMSFAKEQNTDAAYPGWMLRNAGGDRGRIAGWWPHLQLGLVTATSRAGNPLLLVSTKEGTSRVDVDNYTGNDVKPADLKFLREQASGLRGTITESTSSAEFKAWFRDGKLVNEDGSPLRLYHGTTNTKIKAFKMSPDGALGAGIYMTPLPDFASSYAEGEGGNVLPVYTNLQNPLIIDDTSSRDPMVQALMKLGEPMSKAESIVEKAYDTNGYVGKQVMSRAEAQGYDGIVRYKDGKIVEVVAYHATYVKSAIGNSGNYRRGLPDITSSISFSQGDRVTSVYDKEKKGTILAVRDQGGDRVVLVVWDGNYRDTGHDWKATSYQPGSHADPRERLWYPEEEVTRDNTDISFSINTPSSAKVKSVARGALDVIGDALTNGNYASATVTEILGRVQSLAASHIQVAIQTGKRIDESLRLRAKTTKTAYKKVQDAYDARISQIESTADPAARQGLIESFINDFQDAARGYVTNRNAIDEMTNELIRLRLMDKRPFTSREAATYTSLKNNLGDYYTRAYLLHMEGTDSKFAKLLRKQRSNADAGSTVAEDLEGRQTILDAIEFVQNSFNIIPEDSVLENKNLADLTRLAKFWAIETRTDEDDVGLRKEALIDKLSAKREKIAGTPGMSRARAVQLVDEILDNAADGALVSYFSSATENRSILKKKEAVPLPLRKLMGEVTYNPDKALVTLTKQANLVTRTAALFELLEYGLESGDIISQEDYAEQGLDNKEWGQPLTGESFGPLQGYRAKTALYNRIKDITKIDVTWQDALELAENRPGTLIGKIWEEAGSKLSTAGTVYKKTMLMYNPYNMAPNLLGGPVTIVSNGGGGALHLKRAFKTAGKLVASEFTDIKDADVSEVIRAQVVDSAILGSIRAEDRHKLEDMMKRFQEDKSDSDDMVKLTKAWFGKRWETVKTVDKAYTEMYAMMDVVWKIANYYDIHDTLTRFNELEGTGKTAETIEREAGEQTRLSNISFSMVPKAIRALEKVPVLYIAPYYYEAIRSPIGSFILGARYMGEASRATNPEAKALMYKKGGLRMAGAATAISGIAQMAASAVLLMMAGKPEDDEEKRRARAELGASFSKFNTALYIGKDPQGRDITFDLSKFDPLGPLSQFPSMYLRGATEEEYKEAIKGLLIPNPASSGIAKAIFNMATGKESSVEGVEFRNLPLIGEELFEATMMVGPNFTKVVDVFTPTLASRNFSPTKADLSQTDQDMFTSAVTKTLQAIGAKYEVTDVPTSVSWAVRELKDTRKELSADLRTAITSRNLTENEAWEIILDAEKQERESYAKLRRIVEASATLGYKPNQVLQLMRGTPAERGLSLTDINVIASNTYATAPTAIISTDGLKGIRASILEARETPATIDLQKKNFNTLLAVLKQRNYPIRR